MDVGAYSSQNLISPYLTSVQSEHEGTRPAQKGQNAKADKPVDPTTIPAAKETEADKHLLPGKPDPSKVNSADQADDTRDAQAKAAEEQEIRALEMRDREVRDHEAAHKAAGGQYTGAASFQYESGPDGHRYAVSGEVSIDVSKERTPEATIAKMRQIKAAAMAPADPSAQDRSVAAMASAKSMEAARELRSEESSESEADDETYGLLRTDDSTQMTGKNIHSKDYQKNVGIVDPPALMGKSGDATGFQDSGMLKAGSYKNVFTYA